MNTGRWWNICVCAGLFPRSVDHRLRQKPSNHGCLFDHLCTVLGLLRRGWAMGISRRDFLMRVGQAGGYTAAFATMQSLGLIPMKGVAAEPIRAEAGIGNGVKVVVLGGGIGGLVSAYEMKKLG